MLESSSRTAPTPSFFATFTGLEITAIRRSVARYAAQLGLTGEQLQDFVLAVNEIVTNAVMHGGGYGELRLWGAGKAVGCEVVDMGPGGAAEVAAGPAEAGGRGMRLARLLVDELHVVDSPTGTVVRLVTSLPVTG
ncbi:MAG TPA: ATP-binding protein [Pseudonocardiaceae bacterium]|jgi:anti-sigma regulatory factor (Ser/Thr protein kinase)